MDTLKLKPMIFLLLFHYLLMSDIAHNVIFYYPYLLLCWWKRVTLTHTFSPMKSEKNYTSSLEIDDRFTFKVLSNIVALLLLFSDNQDIGF